MDNIIGYVVALAKITFEDRFSYCVKYHKPFDFITIMCLFARVNPTLKRKQWLTRRPKIQE